MTDVPDDELAEFRKQLENDAVNPMVLKKRLARELVTQFYDEKAAAEAEDNFARVVQKKEVPEEIQEFKISTGIPISRLLVDAGLVASRSQANRLIQQGAVSMDGVKVEDANQLVEKNIIIKVGKRRYLRST